MEADAGVHPIHGFADDRQANAGAVLLASVLEALEDSKNNVMVFGCNAEAVILYPEADAGCMSIAGYWRRERFGPETDVRLHSGRHKFHGVAQ